MPYIQPKRLTVVPSGQIVFNAQYTSMYLFSGKPQSPNIMPIDAAVGTASDPVQMTAAGLGTINTSGYYFMRWSYYCVNNVTDILKLNNEVVQTLFVNGSVQGIEGVGRYTYNGMGNIATFSEIRHFNATDGFHFAIWTVTLGGDNVYLNSYIEPATTTLIPAFKVMIYRLWD